MPAHPPVPPHPQDDEPSGATTPGTALLGKAIVWTPEFERLGQQVARWICLECPGAFAYGIQRSGKSSALRMLARTIEDFTGSRMLGCYVSIAADTQEKGASFIAEWLARERVMFSGTNAVKLMDKLKQHFEEQAQQRETDEILLIVDEGQNMSRAHLHKLLHLGNMLTDAGLRVFTLLCGQPELVARVDSYAAMAEVHLLGRFFERKIEFFGIAPSSIETVLKAHEANVSNPDGTESPAAVANLFPKAWEEGWRPSAWTGAIIEGLAVAAVKNGLPRDQRIPLQHLRGCVLWQIMMMKAAGDPWLPVTSQTVVAALEELGLAANWARYAAAKRPLGGGS